MLEIAKAKLKEEAKKNIEFLQGNAMALPFENENFDASYDWLWFKKHT